MVVPNPAIAESGKIDLGRLEIRPYRIGDEASINDAFNRINGTVRSLDEWRWKFSREPEGRWIMLTELAGVGVVAQFAAIGTRVMVGGKEYRAGQNVDAFSLRKHELVQARVFERTAREFYRRFGGGDKLSFLFGFPGTRHLLLGRRRLGYAIPRPVSYWRQAAAERSSWRLWWQVEKGFDSRTVDELWARAAGRYPNAVMRDSRWARRRYVSKPGEEYLYLTVRRRRREAEAWAVAKPGPRILRWVDLVWDGRDPAALEVLSRTFLTMAKRSRLPAVELWLDGDERAARVLEEHGWIRMTHPLELNFTIVSFDPSIHADELAATFYVTMGDSDLV